MHSMRLIHTRLWFESILILEGEKRRKEEEEYKLDMSLCAFDTFNDAHLQWFGRAYDAELVELKEFVE